MKSKSFKSEDGQRKLSNAPTVHEKRQQKWTELIKRDQG